MPSIFILKKQKFVIIIAIKTLTWILRLSFACNSAVAHTRARWLRLQDVAAVLLQLPWTPVGTEGLSCGQWVGLQFCLNHLQRGLLVYLYIKQIT